MLLWTKVFLVVLSVVAPRRLQAYHDADKCLMDNVNNTEGIASCFRTFQSGPYALCFNDTSIEAFLECMDASPGTADPWECGGVMMCAYDTYLAGAEAYLAQMGGLDECVQSSAVDFMQCGMANLVACHEPCEGAYSEETTTLFPGLPSTSATTCDAFQTGISDVACGSTSCCSTCQGFLEAVLECVSNTVFTLQCDLVCFGENQTVSPAGTRRMGRRDLVAPNVRPDGRLPTARYTPGEAGGRSLEEEETLDVHVSKECPYSLVNSTTLQSLTTTPALFLDCVVLHYLWMFTDEGMEYVMGASAGNGTGSNATTSSSSSDGEAGGEEGEPAAGGTTTSGSSPVVVPPFLSWRTAVSMSLATVVHAGVVAVAAVVV